MVGSVHSLPVLMFVVGIECCTIQERHGKLPAEHGHGTEYTAPAETQWRWKEMDPTNTMNPGVGGLSSKYKYR